MRLHPCLRYSKCMSALRKSQKLSVRSPTTYVIQVMGWLREDWAEWLCGVTLRHKKDAGGRVVTELTVPLTDQSALHGILTRLHALNLELVSVTQLIIDESESGADK